MFIGLLMFFTKSALTLERYEQKFLISPEMVDPLSSFLDSHCYLDPYSKLQFSHSSPNSKYYFINNIYFGHESDFENEEDLNLKETSCLLNKFKFYMRVRSYGKQAQCPYFFELKYQVRDFIKKKRSQINTESWSEILRCYDGNFHRSKTFQGSSYIEDFLFTVMKYKMAPIFQSRYLRKAYVSKDEELTRVSFDKDFYFRKVKDWNLISELGEIHSCQGIKDADKVILELKWNGVMPMWMNQVIDQFSLRECAFSKYNLARSFLQEISNKSK